MATKKLNTTVKTGDIFTGIDGVTYKVGTYRKVNGKGIINLFVRINKTSGYTVQVSTRQLNKLLNKN